METKWKGIIFILCIGVFVSILVSGYALKECKKEDTPVSDVQTDIECIAQRIEKIELDLDKKQGLIFTDDFGNTCVITKQDIEDLDIYKKEYLFDFYITEPIVIIQICDPLKRKYDILSSLEYTNNIIYFDAPQAYGKIWYAYLELEDIGTDNFFNIKNLRMVYLLEEDGPRDIHITAWIPWVYGKKVSYVTGVIEIQEDC